MSKRKRANNEDDKENLRGEIRRLRKALAQANRQIERMNGLAEWGWLGEGEESPAPSSPQPLSPSTPSDPKPDGTVCPKACGILLILRRPDGSALRKCTVCGYRKLLHDSKD